jgi:hypothetical protein
MQRGRFHKLLAFLDRLQTAKIPFQLRHHVQDAISVEVYAPSEHWEVDFFRDGDVYVERFRSNGHIDEESALAELFRLCADEEPPAPQSEATTKRPRKTG